MFEYPENSWEQSKSELKVRFAKVNDPVMLLPCCIRQEHVRHESVQIYAERLYALENDSFTKVYKAVIEPQLVAFSLMVCTMNSYTWRS